MPISIDIPEAKDDTPFNAAFKRLRAIDERFSSYKPSSELCRFQRGEIPAADLSAEMKQVIKACTAAKKMTNGYFSAYYGSPVSHLDAVQGSKEERASRTDAYGERVTDAADTAMRQKPAGVTGSAGQQGEAVRTRWFDPTGYVKGWAIAEAGQVIEKLGFKTYCIGAGGDILARSVGEKTWNIGIQDPSNPGKILNMLSITNGAVATSGNYERGAHIINPKTKKPANELLSLSITGPDIITADVLATAGFAMGKTGVDFVNSQSGYKALAVAREIV